MNLTKKADIEALTIPPPKPDGRPSEVIYKDDRTPGFAIRATSGGSKTYIAQKRVKGRWRRVKIARVGEITLDQARRLASEKLGQMAMGVDPAQARTAETQSRKITLARAFEDYLGRRRLKPNTLRTYRQVFQAAFSDWLTRPMANISKDMVAKRHQKLGESSQSQANSAMRVLRAIFNFAQGQYEDAKGASLFPENPVRRLAHNKSWFPAKRKRTVIAPKDMPHWYTAVMALGEVAARDAETGCWLAAPKNGPHCRDYFLTLLYTGLRKTEALDLKWEDIDFDAKTLTVQDTKNHEALTLPISTPLLEILQRRHDQRCGEFVFSAGLGVRLQNMRNALDWVQRQSDVRFSLHDLRRTFSTAAQTVGLDLYTIKRLMNHKLSNDVTEGYIVLATEHLREPSERVARYMDGLFEGNVIPFRSSGSV